MADTVTEFDYLKEVRANYAEIKRENRDIKTRLNSLARDLDGLRSDVHSVIERMDDTEERLGQIEKKIDVFSADFYARFDEQSNRSDTLNAKLDAILARLPA